MVSEGSPPDPLFAELSLFLDPTPHSPSRNMALDEVLLRENLPSPVLRFYEWSCPAVSLGYFQKWKLIAPWIPPDTTPVRRWTGGGFVDHRKDLTYSLIIPAACAVDLAPPQESYRSIHSLLAEALNNLGHPCYLSENANPHPPSQPSRCFEGTPARFDLLDATGKIAGASQRRSRYGILHQGSMALQLPGSDLGRRFADLLAARVTGFLPSESVMDKASRMVETRYGSPEWLKKF